jgi:methylmalonyl-CoA/ethylmalonyl-CoA epimerase
LYRDTAAPAAPGRVKAVVGNMGQIRLQIIQPLEGQSMFREFLESRGEGVHHYAFLVDDIDTVESGLVKQGVKILSRARLESGGGHVIVDSSEFGGIFIELMQPPAEWLAGFPPLPIF